MNFYEILTNICTKIYYYLICKRSNKSIILDNNYCTNCREFLLNQDDSNSSDYSEIYIDNVKLDNF